MEKLTGSYLVDSLNARATWLKNTSEQVDGTLDRKAALALEQSARAMVKAFKELNTIRARDGVPYTHMGWKASVDEEYFSSVVDSLDQCVKLITGQTAHCHPYLYEE